MVGERGRTKEIGREADEERNIVKGTEEKRKREGERRRWRLEKDKKTSFTS